MLNDLRGKRHTVLTGVCAMCTGSDQEALGVSRSAVKFCDFTDDALDMYVASGEPLDRAGAYAIQGGGSDFVEAVAGRIDTVIGLDVGLALRLLGEIGYPDPLPRTTDIMLTAHAPAASTRAASHANQGLTVSRSRSVRALATHLTAVLAVSISGSHRARARGVQH